MNLQIGCAEIYMTYSDIANIVLEIGLPCAYDHFAQNESPYPPFALFLLTNTNNFMADGIVYQEMADVAIELYTDVKEPLRERQVESILDTHDITWDKTETWLEGEGMYEVRYAFTVEYDAEDSDNYP